MNGITHDAVQQCTCGAELGIRELETDNLGNIKRLIVEPCYNCTKRNEYARAVFAELAKKYKYLTTSYAARF